MTCVSIIVPVHNVDKYLKKCLDSLLCQKLEEIEIIVINDGSTDDSQKIIDEYKLKDSRIKSIYQENSGPHSARNRGISVAKGKYIGFVDSDDSVNDNMFFELYNKAEELEADLVTCNYVNEFDNGRVTNTIYNIKSDFIKISDCGISQFIINEVLTYSIGSEVWSKLFRTSTIREYGIKFESHKEILGEDILFILYYLLYADVVVYINKPLYYHYIRTGSLTNSEISKMSERFMKLIERFIIKAKEEGLFSDVQKAIPLMVYNMVGCSVAYENGIRKKYMSLRKASEFGAFTSSMVVLARDTSSGIIKTIFGILCKRRCFFVATLLRILLDFIIKLRRKNEKKI